MWYIAFKVKENNAQANFMSADLKVLLVVARRSARATNFTFYSALSTHYSELTTQHSALFQ